MTSETDARLKKELGVGRQLRENVDRPSTESRVVQDADRLDMFRRQNMNDALPDIPEIPGYHVCWLTTTDPRDPIHRRMRLGYEPIAAKDIPGMEYVSVKTGEWAGMIGVNEMLAFKLPNHLYQMFMKEAHYDAPLREEQKLLSAQEHLAEEARRRGAALIEDEGIAALRQRAPAVGTFS